MSDYRTAFLQAVEQTIFSLVNPEKAKEITDKITILLNDYEITERCTDIVPVDGKNERLLKKYLACLMVDGKSEKTAYQYRRSLVRLAEFLQKDYTDMGTYDIRFFIASEKERGISDRTCENLRANLSAFFQWMTTEEIIPRNPMAKIKPIKYADEIRKDFSDVEIDKLRFACKNDKERALIEFLLASGVRVTELSEMLVDDVDFQTLDVHVIHGKGAKERMTYITPVALERLKKYILGRPQEESKYLFYNAKHQQLEPGGIRNILNRIAERAGVTNVHPHRFRRTFATKLARRGMEIQEIQRLLGHTNVNTTLEYICIDDAGIKASYKKYIA